MNKSFEIRLALVITVAATIFPGVCYGSRSGNLEYWQEHKVDFDINKDFTFGAKQELRFGQHNGNPCLYNVDMGLEYKGLADWMKVGFWFKKEYEQDSAGKFRHENRPHLDLTFSRKVLDLGASDRLRLEYRDREHKESVWRMRNLVAVKFPVKLTKVGFEPFISHEQFIDLGENNLNQTRLASGFSWDVNENMKCSIFYMLKQSKITGGWRDTNVIGTQFKFSF